MADLPESRDPGVSLPRPLFGDDPQVFFPEHASAPTHPPSKSNRSVYSRFVLPAFIFLIGVACIAWAAQYLPGRGRARAVSKAVDEVIDAIQFDGRKGPQGQIWPIIAADDKDNVTEFELGVPGRQDFQFNNVTTTDVDLGVFSTSCGCTSVQVCVFQSDKQKKEYDGNKDAAGLPWTSVDIDRSLRKSIRVPANAEGVFRVTWTAKTEPEPLSMRTEVWSRASGGEKRTYKLLEISVNYVRAALFSTEKVDLGTLNPKDRSSDSLYCWSATRDIVVTPTNVDQRLKVEVVPLPAKDRETLQEWLFQRKIYTRVRSAYKINVTLMEEHDGKHLDLGLLLKPVPLSIKSDGVEFEVPLPTLRAYIRGDVVLAGPEEGGRVDLKIFSAKIGTSKKVALAAPKGGKLTFIGCEPALLDLNVSLTALKTEADKAHWEMEVSAKPNHSPGPLPEDGVVVLRLEIPAIGTASAVTREVRIPVIGTAGSH